MQGDYTIGKLLEYELYQRFLEKEITYVAFYKKHPHDTIGILRVASKGSSPESIRAMIQAASEECIKKCKEFSSLIQ
jgi:DNA-directed RNA polymerase subunit L